MLLLLVLFLLSIQLSSILIYWFILHSRIIDHLLAVETMNHFANNLESFNNEYNSCSYFWQISFDTRFHHQYICIILTLKRFFSYGTLSLLLLSFNVDRYAFSIEAFLINSSILIDDFTCCTYLSYSYRFFHKKILYKIDQKWKIY